MTTSFEVAKVSRGESRLTADDALWMLTGSATSTFGICAGTIMLSPLLTPSKAYPSVCFCRGSFRLVGVLTPDPAEGAGGGFDELDVPFGVSVVLLRLS
jgi:hypothetical protein